MAISRPRSHIIYTITVIGFIFSLHISIPVYSNSSFLNLFADANTIGLIYMTGAATSILAFILAPFIIRKLGNYTSVIVFICIQIALFYGLISSTSSKLLVLFFILQSAIASLIGLCLDIFLEKYSDKDHVGMIRGLYSATLNASWVFGPLIGSILINHNNNYQNTYIASLAILFPLIYLIHRNFPRFHDPKYEHPSLWESTKNISTDKNLLKLFYANITLQTFYSWMVVYSPIYLNKNIGFEWSEIGLILVIMLLPFPFIQYPLGKMSDQKYGEKNIMAIGFAIMGISTILLSYFVTKDIFIWALMLFITRVGAATAEIMLEIYFFKKVKIQDSSILSAFRITRPLSFFSSSIIMIIGLLFVDYRYMFAVIGIFSLLALLPILTMKDAK